LPLSLALGLSVMSTRLSNNSYRSLFSLFF
jgi:hypothetical protein